MNRGIADRWAADRNSPVHRYRRFRGELSGTINILPADISNGVPLAPPVACRPA